MTASTTARIGNSHTATLQGIHAAAVSVETDIGGAVPHFIILGLADKAVQECRERIRSAAKAVGVPLPAQRITVNLSPANQPKSGTHFDLAILMSILDRQNLVAGSARTFFAAELGLDGSLKPVRGILPLLLAARQQGITQAVVAVENLAEAELVAGINVTGYHHLVAVLADFLTDPTTTLRPVADTGATTPEATEAGNKHSVNQVQEELDFADIVGQHHAKFVLEVAAAGRHHVFFLGPPGAGKTMLAQRLPTILPPLAPAAALESTAIASLYQDEGSIRGLLTTPNFVNPHHSASTAALIGSGRPNTPPGAITRAHHGVLFLDEAPEFKRDALEALRQPLESQSVTVMRAGATVNYPCDFQLVMAANPCPCGLHPSAQCRCSPQQRHRYLSRVSPPLLDRIDLQVRVEAVARNQLSAAQGPSSAEVAARVAAARQRQSLRLAPLGLSLNSQLNLKHLMGLLRLPQQVTSSLDRFLERGGLSIRSYVRILRTSWTLADLAGADAPDQSCVDAAYALRMNL